MKDREDFALRCTARLRPTGNSSSSGCSSGGGGGSSSK